MSEKREPNENMQRFLSRLSERYTLLTGKNIDNDDPFQEIIALFWVCMEEMSVRQQFMLPDNVDKKKKTDFQNISIGFFCGICFTIIIGLIVKFVFI